MKSAGSVLREIQLVRSSLVSEPVKAKLVAALERELETIAASLPDAVKTGSDPAVQAGAAKGR